MHAECVLTVCVYAVLVRMCSLLYISVLYAVYRVFVLVSQTGELRCVLAGYTRQSYTLLHGGSGHLTVSHSVSLASHIYQSKFQ